MIECQSIFIGVNALDYLGYPDCRPEYIKAYEEMANLATKQSIKGGRFTIHAPLIDQTKAQIIKQGQSLGLIILKLLVVTKSTTKAKPVVNVTHSFFDKMALLKQE